MQVQGEKVEFEIIKNTLKHIWLNDIPIVFNKGLLVYERQLQALLFHFLKLNLIEDKYEIWVEPVIDLSVDGLTNVIPDIVIVHNNLVVALIEIKFTPWQYTNIRDINKLILLQDFSARGLKFPLGHPTTTSKWVRDKVRMVDFNPNYISCFIVFSKNDKIAFDINHDKLRNFFHLIGYINDDSNKPIFEEKRYLYLPAGNSG